VVIYLTDQTLNNPAGSVDPTTAVTGSPVAEDTDAPAPVQPSQPAQEPQAPDVVKTQDDNTNTDTPSI